MVPDGRGVSEIAGLDLDAVQEILSNMDMPPLVVVDLAAITPADGWFWCSGGECRWFRTSPPIF